MWLTSEYTSGVHPRIVNAPKPLKVLLEKKPGIPTFYLSGTPDESVSELTELQNRCSLQVKYYYKRVGPPKEKAVIVILYLFIHGAAVIVSLY